MKPLIKWVGGKRRFINIINQYIPTEINKYYEPFLGSASLFLHINPSKAYLNDYNEDLINFYNHVSLSPEKLHSMILRMISSKKDPDSYYEIRAEYNRLNDNSTIEKATMFFYLNRVGYNGVYRVNSSGGYNVPVGNCSSHYVPSLDEFIRVSESLKNIKITSGEWQKSVKYVSKNDLIYLDPPYYPDESSKFTGYTDPKFGAEQHKEIVIKAWEWTRKGANVLISNSASDEFEQLVRERFGENYFKVEIPTRRSINPKSKNKERFIETLYILKGEKNG